MATWIAWLRGINVGGKNRLPMADLRHALEAQGLAQVETLLQSGNVLFESRSRSAAALATEVGAACDAAAGFVPGVQVWSLADVERALERQPFEPDVEGRSVHLFFLDREPSGDRSEPLDALAAASEAWQLDGRMFYLSAPEGMARSKLGAGAERALGVDATARNLRTVRRVVDRGRARSG